MQKLDIHAERTSLGRRVSLYIEKRRSDDALEMVVAQPLVFGPPVDVGLMVDPTVELHWQDAQQLMDELWRCGLRPAGADSPGELAATRAHLADMQSLAIGALRKNGAI